MQDGLSEDEVPVSTSTCRSKVSVLEVGHEVGHDLSLTSLYALGLLAGAKPAFKGSFQTKSG